jgi:RNA polymerase sigma-70 factor (ECF subfamily)
MPGSENVSPAALVAARRGSKEALGELLERYRHYLLLVAEQELDPALRGKAGASDLVQETFLEAQRDFAAFAGASEQELLAWLRRLLRNNLANFARRYRGTAKRQIGREVRPGAGSSARQPLDRLPSAARTPGEEVIARERAGRVWEALERLPDKYRRALLLRCRDGCSFEEIGRRMKRSRNAAQKLWARAVERLQQHLGPDL